LQPTIRFNLRLADQFTQRRKTNHDPFLNIIKSKAYTTLTQTSASFTTGRIKVAPV